MTYRQKNHTLLPVWMVASIILVVSGCSQHDDKPLAVENFMEDSLQQSQEFQAQYTAANVPDEVSAALIVNDSQYQSASAETLRFDVSVNQVPAKAFFISLVADSGINVVAHPEVSGVISLDLKQVTVPEVLNVIRDVYGYEYKFSEGIYTIYPLKLRTQMFPINYLDVKRVGVTDTGVHIGEITSNSSNGSNNGSNGQSSSRAGNATNLLGSFGDDGAKGGGRQSTGGISPGTRVQTLSKTDFWSGLHQAVMEIIGGDEEGRFVMTNPLSGIVVVKAMPRELNSVREFLEKSELNVKRQVVLETKILEVTLNDGFEAGINWGAISGQIAMEQVNTASASLERIILGGKGATESIITSAVDILDITKLLKLLETQGSVQVLSSPRVSTVNNQKAVIRVGSDEFFVTGISNSTASSASTIITTPEIQFDSFFSGISLDVTPQVSANGDVILHIHPLVSKVEDQIKQIDFGGETFSLPLALRDIRESDSIVKAKDGQVVVLGGLMQESVVDIDGKRPLLGDIPLLKYFFKTKKKGLKKTELVILLRPIVIADGSYEQMVEEETRRMNAISQQYKKR